MTKIIICIDGTGNEIGDRESNVLKLYKALHIEEGEQIAHYVLGVGTYDGTKLMGRARQAVRQLLGQAFGLGLEDDVLSAYRYLCQRYRSADEKRAAQPGLSQDAATNDQIYICGFSRGAYAARILAGFIHNFGLVSPDKLHLIAPVFRAYRRVTDFEKSAADERVFQALREYEGVLRPQNPPVRALLLFDTVSSLIRFRRPWHNITHNYSVAEFGTHASVNSNVSVRIVLHALARDEKRALFRAQHWQPAASDCENGTPLYFGNNFRNDKAQRLQYVRQRWFRGYHSDVGGSPPENESGLGKITLLWMLDALAEAERQADAEDNVARKKARRSPLPKPSEYGLTLRRGARKRYLEGAVEGAKTPGGLPYAPPDPDALAHNSHTHGPLAPLWVVTEFLPKSVKRREPGKPAWFRRAWLLGLWYLPLFEPRRLRAGDETAPEASESSHTE